MDRSVTIARLQDTQATLRENVFAALYLFGSLARDEAGMESDVDLFVDPDDDRFDFVALVRVETMLAQALGRPVVLTMRAGLHPSLRAGIAGMMTVSPSAAVLSSRFNCGRALVRLLGLS